MKTRFCLEVAGDYACFSRPEMKVERVSYDVITPSAARAVFEAILWKPGLRWRLRRIEILKPLSWISLRRNEVGAVASSRNALLAMKEGRGNVGLNIEDERQQRAGLFLRDVAYRLHADLELESEESQAHPAKYASMFARRAAHGQCINQPYLGCREFAASFRLIELVGAERSAREGEAPPVQSLSADLGWMLYDIDFNGRHGPAPQFFRATVKNGVVDLADIEIRG
jgi:CRISPR-associated protein Cas5d